MLLARLNELKAIIDSLNESRNGGGFGSIVFKAEPYGQDRWSVLLYPEGSLLFFSHDVSRIMTYCHIAGISVVISSRDGAPSLYLQ